jgi:hypothetical protein
MRNSNYQNRYRGKRIAGKLSLVVENAEEAVDAKTAEVYYVRPQP